MPRLSIVRSEIKRMHGLHKSSVPIRKGRRPLPILYATSTARLPEVARASQSLVDACESSPPPVNSSNPHRLGRLVSMCDNGNCMCQGGLPTEIQYTDRPRARLAHGPTSSMQNSAGCPAEQDAIHVRATARRHGLRARESWARAALDLGGGGCPRRSLR
jgi:hypothetical protein